MQLVKHVHACVSVIKPQGRIVIDPGTLTPDAAAAVSAADAVLVTHEHFDHCDEGLIAEALASRPDLRVYGPASVTERWSGRPGQVTAVKAGDEIGIAGFDISVVGELHAAVHRDIPRIPNVGYVVDGRLYHPGDAYFVPPAPIETLLLPTSGPWAKLDAAVDFVREVAPSRLVQIHEVLLSEAGQRAMARFLSPDGLVAVPLMIVAAGDAIAV